MAKRKKKINTAIAKHTAKGAGTAFAAGVAINSVAAAAGRKHSVVNPLQMAAVGGTYSYVGARPKPMSRVRKKRY